MTLRAYKAWYEDLKVKNGDRWEYSPYVFVNDSGGPLHPDSITKWLTEFADRHGLVDVHPHKFRHTMASVLINNGTDIVAVSKRLGHAKVSTTTDIYSHIINEADAKSAECIADTYLRRNPTAMYELHPIC
ncbi:MAG: tyrosine-type recombinase/integrase [Candidatus Limivicinus sp.]|nr:tyrosine-type recombinase/integrase [Candidatus Limivicinus sp.]